MYAKFDGEEEKASPPMSRLNVPTFCNFCVPAPVSFHDYCPTTREYQVVPISYPNFLTQSLQNL
jgi:hypothetical protein